MTTAGFALILWFDRVVRAIPRGDPELKGVRSATQVARLAQLSALGYLLLLIFFPSLMLSVEGLVGYQLVMLVAGVFYLGAVLRFRAKWNEGRAAGEAMPRCSLFWSLIFGPVYQNFLVARIKGEEV